MEESEESQWAEGLSRTGRGSSRMLHLGYTFEHHDRRDGVGQQSERNRLESQQIVVHKRRHGGAFHRHADEGILEFRACDAS